MLFSAITKARRSCLCRNYKNEIHPVLAVYCDKGLSQVVDTKGSLHKQSRQRNETFCRTGIGFGEKLVLAITDRPTTTLISNCINQVCESSIMQHSTHYIKTSRGGVTMI